MVAARRRARAGGSDGGVGSRRSGGNRPRLFARAASGRGRRPGDSPG